jgi:hypothetical protein
MDLTPQQAGLYEKWIDRFQVWTLTNPDVAATDPNSPAAMEQEFLLVRLGDKKLELHWTGVSAWNNCESKDKLQRALDALVKMSLDLLKQAGKI